MKPNLVDKILRNSIYKWATIIATIAALITFAVSLHSCTKSPTNPATNGQSSSQDTTQVTSRDATPTNNVESPPAPKYQEFTLSEGESEDVPDTDIIVTLISESFEGDPLRFRVTAVVNSPTLGESRIENEEVGYVFTYGNKYRIMIYETVSLDVTFRVTPIAGSK